MPDEVKSLTPAEIAELKNRKPGLSLDDEQGRRHDYLVIERPTVLRLLDMVGEEESGWRDIETAPKNGTFLIWAADRAWPAYQNLGKIYSNAHGAINEPGERWSLAVTHWMPMPPAPPTPKGE